MQETEYQVNEGKKILQEFFDSEQEMDKRLGALTPLGHTLIKRVKINRNDKCPCGSGIKFKRCCIDKIGKEYL